MKKYLILILPLLIGCAAPLYHCEEVIVYNKNLVSYPLVGSDKWVNEYEVDHKYTECYPEKVDNDD